MPDLGLKLHDGWAEGVLARDLDVDRVGCALVRSVGRPQKLASQMCEIFPITRRLDDDLGVLVVVDVGNLLCDAPVAVGGHLVGWSGRVRGWKGGRCVYEGAGGRREIEGRRRRQQVVPPRCF